MGTIEAVYIPEENETLSEAFDVIMGLLETRASSAKDKHHLKSISIRWNNKDTDLKLTDKKRKEEICLLIETDGASRKRKTLSQTFDAVMKILKNQPPLSEHEKHPDMIPGRYITLEWKGQEIKLTLEDQENKEQICAAIENYTKPLGPQHDKD